jgi:hypothetical protein
MKLSMIPQSSRFLSPLAKDGIAQTSVVEGAPPGTNTLKIRWKVSYMLKGELIEENGESNSVQVG